MFTRRSAVPLITHSITLSHSYEIFDTVSEILKISTHIPFTLTPPFIVLYYYFYVHSTSDISTHSLSHQIFSAKCLYKNNWQQQQHQQGQHTAADSMMMSSPFHHKTVLNSSLSVLSETQISHPHTHTIHLLTSNIHNIYIYQYYCSLLRRKVYSEDERIVDDDVGYFDVVSC